MKQVQKRWWNPESSRETNFSVEWELRKMKGEFSCFILYSSICLHFKNKEYWICFNFIMEKNLKELSRINFGQDTWRTPPPPTTAQLTWSSPSALALCSQYFYLTYASVVALVAKLLTSQRQKLWVILYL